MDNKETSESRRERRWEEKKERFMDRDKRPGRMLAGVILILLGAGFLMQNIFKWFDFNYVWPVILIIIGVFFLVRK